MLRSKFERGSTAGHQGIAFLLIVWIYLLASIPPSTAQTTCNSRLDYVFLLDSSSSITSPNWDMILNFVCNSVISNLNVSRDAVHVGIVRYSTDAQIIFGLDQYYTSTAASAGCNAISFTGGSTNLASALQLGLTVFQQSTRNNSAKVTVIITDGRSNDPVASETQANITKAAGIKIVGIAIVPDTSQPGFIEIQRVATSPEEVLQLWVTDFSDLNAKLSALLAYSCISPQPQGTSASWQTTPVNPASRVSGSFSTPGLSSTSCPVPEKNASTSDSIAEQNCGAWALELGLIIGIPCAVVILLLLICVFVLCAKNRKLKKQLKRCNASVEMTKSNTTNVSLQPSAVSPHSATEDRPYQVLNDDRNERPYQPIEHYDTLRSNSRGPTYSSNYEQPGNPPQSRREDRRYQGLNKDKKNEGTYQQVEHYDTLQRNSRGTIYSSNPYDFASPVPATMNGVFRSS